MSKIKVKKMNETPMTFVVDKTPGWVITKSFEIKIGSCFEEWELNIDEHYK